MKKGETRETGTGGTQKARRGNRWERNLEGDGRWSGRGEACRNGMRRTMSERWRKGGAKPGRADALKAEHDGPFPAGLSASATDKSRGFGGNYFPRRGRGGGAPHTKPIPRSRTGPALFRSERGVGDPAAFSRRSFSICYRTNQGGSGEIISPGGAWGGAPHTKTHPAKPNRPRAVQKRAWRRGTRRPFPAGLSASATDKSRGLGGNYFPRRGAGRSPA